MGKGQTKLTAHLHLKNGCRTFDLTEGLDISIPIDVYGDQVNCYYGDKAYVTAHSDGESKYTLQEGATVNSYELHTHIHCNGSHTESAAHVYEEAPTIDKIDLRQPLLAQVISVSPMIKEADQRIELKDIQAHDIFAEAIILRTLPNPVSKKTKNYSGKNPTYLSSEVADYLRNKGVKHLVVDLPSVDSAKSKKMLSHKAFFGQNEERWRESSITELVYLNNSISDGLYLLQLSVLPINVDASPCRAVLYKEIDEH